jgi:hypothetical protein
MSARPGLPRIIVTSLFLGCLAAGCMPVDNRTANRAEDACRAAARDDGYNNVRTTGNASGLGNSVVLSLTGSRNGRSYDGTCTYDRRNRDASIDCSRGGSDSGSFSRAQSACKQEAKNRNFSVRDIDSGDRSGNAIKFDMRLRRSGDDYRGVCTYKNGNANIQTDKQ